MQLKNIQEKYQIFNIQHELKIDSTDYGGTVTIEMPVNGFMRMVTDLLRTIENEESVEVYDKVNIGYDDIINF